MKTIIAGSRDGGTAGHVHKAIIEAPWDISTVVSGTARGADQLGEQWADMFDIPVDQYPAQWDVFGKSAGYVRNETMARNAEALIAVWDGKSRGTKHMIDLAYKYNRKVFVYTVEQ